MFTLDDPDHGPTVLLPVLLADARAVADYAASLRSDDRDPSRRAVKRTVPTDTQPDRASELDADALPPTGNAALSDVQWTPAKLTQFSESEVVSVQRFAAALDVMAMDEDRSYGTVELAEAAGVPYTAFKHATTRMTNHLAKHYGIEAWPITANWNEAREEVDWSITKTVAARWREIRGLGTG